MSDVLPEDRSPEPITVDSLVEDLRSLGVEAGQTLLVHGSLSALGWVCGGAPTVVDALQEVIGEEGTLVMPTPSPGNRDPTDMQNPPVPDSWYETIRDQMPPYRPAVTPAQGMGAIAECFRSYPDVHRSKHPQHSFAAWGADAEFVTEDHSLEYSLGEDSPLARIYDLNGDILYLGTSHETSTSIHLAEYRSDLDPGLDTNGSAVLLDGERQWVSFEDINFDDEDFSECGAAFECRKPAAFETDAIGVCEAKLLSQPELVDFAVGWLEANR